ncbi:MAG TPA: carbohydrate kinase family protein [Candidatus Nanoarchaeia archaeon]|nr:carbohydrate kinase family protein [Candidatus Nanoarchaeia archaeon]
MANNARYDVLCIGSATVDRFFTITQPLQSVEIGDKILAKSLEIYTGGGATNSAVALAKLGLKVKVLTKLGNDHEAGFIFDELKRNHVTAICHCLAKGKTDVSAIISSLQGKDRIIYNYKDASRKVGLCSCKKAGFDVEWIYLASLVGKSFQAVQHFVLQAKRKKIKLLFNPSLYLAQRGKAFLQPLLSVTDILILNKKEAQTLLNRSVSQQQLLKELHHLGPKTVVITDGEKKVYAWHEGKMHTLLPKKTKVVQTTGAGDAFSSSLLAGISKGYSFADALHLGYINAASVIKYVGTKNGLLTEAQAMKAMKSKRSRSVR